MTQKQIETKIQEALPHCDVVVMDLTGSGDHWEVRVASHQFAGLSRIKQHQLIMDLFSPELKSGELHALAIKTIIKEE